MYLYTIMYITMQSSFPPQHFAMLNRLKLKKQPYARLDDELLTQYLAGLPHRFQSEVLMLISYIQDAN